MSIQTWQRLVWQLAQVSNANNPFSLCQCSIDIENAAGRLQLPRYIIDLNSVITTDTVLE